MEQNIDFSKITETFASTQKERTVIEVDGVEMIQTNVEGLEAVINPGEYGISGNYGDCSAIIGRLANNQLVYFHALPYDIDAHESIALRRFVYRAISGQLGIYDDDLRKQERLFEEAMKSGEIPKIFKSARIIGREPEIQKGIIEQITEEEVQTDKIPPKQYVGDVLTICVYNDPENPGSLDNYTVHHDEPIPDDAFYDDFLEQIFPIKKS